MGVGGLIMWVCTGLKFYLLYACARGSRKKRCLRVRLRRFRREQQCIHEKLERFGGLSPDLLKSTIIANLEVRIEMLRASSEKIRERLGDIDAQIECGALFMNPLFATYNETLRELEAAKEELERSENMSAHRLRDWLIPGMERELERVTRIVSKLTERLKVTK